MSKRFVAVLLAALAVQCAVTGAWADAPTTDPAQAITMGGALTHYDRSRDAYSRPAPGLSSIELRRFGLGNRVFNTRWVEAPASVSGFDGLGPIFNRDSCSGCHLRDGRGSPPDSGQTERKDTFVVKVAATHRRTQRLVANTFGPQLNTAAIAGVAPEGRAVVRYREISGRYADKSAFSLRQPVVELRDTSFAVDRRMRLHVRVAPAVFGLGLIEAVPADAIIAYADPGDANRDGISGRVNWVTAPGDTTARVGRFGWKARVARLVDQSVDAAIEDIGLTSSVHPQQNCTAAEVSCANIGSGDEVELSAPLLTALVGYLQSLGVPARASTQAPQRRADGFRLFKQLKCDGCHRPMLITGDEHPVALLRNQTIFPYSDFLLHDMGADMAGAANDGDAAASEWRTQPLWGLSLLETVNGHILLLHDGRARSVSEAILWHGGEGTAAREAFRRASSEERLVLSEFVMSL